MLNEEIVKHVESLIAKAASATAPEALNLTQAALNAANAMVRVCEGRKQYGETVK